MIKKDLGLDFIVNVDFNFCGNKMRTRLIIVLNFILPLGEKISWLRFLLNVNYKFF